MNEKFFSISKEKQERIIRCAYEVFSQNSYKEASMSKIADAGGISKSLLFHYFSNKRELKGNFICIFGKMQEGSFVKYRRGITLEQPVFLKSYNKGLWQDSRL